MSTDDAASLLKSGSARGASTDRSGYSSASVKQRPSLASMSSSAAEPERRAGKGTGKGTGTGTGQQRGVGRRIAEYIKPTREGSAT